jgi:glycosyltransferase involved in cell wall biosynthesis
MVPVRSHALPAISQVQSTKFFSRLPLWLSERRRRAFWSSTGPGVFHSSYYSSPDGVAIPQVLTMHDTIFEDYPELFGTERHRRRLREKYVAARHCSAVVFPSEFARIRASEHYDLAGKLVRTIPHALDAGFRVTPSAGAIAGFRERTTAGRPFLLHVGSRFLHKNVARLIEAYSKWRQRDEFALVLAGGGPLDAEEGRLIAELGVGNDVIVIPRLNDADLVLAYHAAAAFVFPSLSEGFGFPVLESLACACPTACANAASLPEVGGDAPVYFDPLDIEAIVAALNEIIASSGDRGRWNAARAQAVQRTWDEVAAEFVDVYNAIL